MYKYSCISYIYIYPIFHIYIYFYIYYIYNYIYITYKFEFTFFKKTQFSTVAPGVRNGSRFAAMAGGDTTCGAEIMSRLPRPSSGPGL